MCVHKQEKDNEGEKQKEVMVVVQNFKEWERLPVWQKNHIESMKTQ